MKLNVAGIELLEYKKELLKSHNYIVQNALYAALDIKLQANLLSEETCNLIKDTTVSYEEFHTYLMEQKEFLKSKKDLLNEYDQFKYDFSNKIMNYNIELLSSVSDIENEKISFIKTFSIDENFVSHYFGIKDEEEIALLLKRNGFIETFSALRLKKIVEDWYIVFKHTQSESFNDELIAIEVSPVYYNAAKNSYDIDILMHFDYEKLHKPTYEETIIRLIRNVVDSSKAQIFQFIIL